MALVPVLEALPPAGVPNFTVTCLHCSHWQSLTELWAASTPPPLFLPACDSDHDGVCKAEDCFDDNPSSAVHC